MTLGALVRHARPAPPLVRRDFDRLVDDLIGGFGLAPVAFDARPAFRPLFEARALGNEYRVTADLPGVDPAELDVSVEDGVLTVRGERHFDGKGSPGAEAPGAEASARFEQRFRFPGEIDEGNVKASCRHGVLTVTVPKAAEPKPEVRTIPVETA